MNINKQSYSNVHNLMNNNSDMLCEDVSKGFEIKVRGICRTRGVSNIGNNADRSLVYLLCRYTKILSIHTHNNERRNKNENRKTNDNE